MKKPLRVLIVEDSEADTTLLLRELEKEGYAPEHERVDTSEAMQNALQKKKWDVVISDYALPRFNGFLALELFKKAGLRIPFILVSATMGEDLAVRAIKQGASDYLLKDRLSRLGQAVSHAIQEKQWYEEKQQADTERKHLEELLRRSQKLEAVGRLVNGVSHDFNNLLTAIMGYPDFIVEQLGPDHPVSRFAEEIRDAANKASALTHQLLAFSSRQSLEPVVINLNIVVTEMEKMLRRLISENIVLITSPGPSLGNVKADRGQIEQVLMNLVVNARDAMPTGGTLVIETSNVVLSQADITKYPEARAGEYILLAVTDNGVGMSQEVVEKIFEPFFTTKNEGKGTGLGLATCHGIIKQSGGFIMVDTAPGKGSSFKVYIPRTYENVKTQPLIDALTKLPKGNETILVVEDDIGVRQITTNLLRNLGYHVLEAENGLEAQNLANDICQKIDLVLTDVVMPQMGGAELAKWITSMNEKVKILFTSGYKDEALRKHYSIGDDASVLHKPFTMGKLASTLRETLDQAPLAAIAGN